MLGVNQLGIQIATVFSDTTQLHGISSRTLMGSVLGCKHNKRVSEHSGGHPKSMFWWFRYVLVTGIFLWSHMAQWAHGALWACIVLWAHGTPWAYGPMQMDGGGGRRAGGGGPSRPSQIGKTSTLGGPKKYCNY